MGAVIAVIKLFVDINWIGFVKKIVFFLIVFFILGFVFGYLFMMIFYIVFVKVYLIIINRYFLKF